jgi:ribosomal protein S18 acetylase RimI-like enzyme
MAALHVQCWREAYTSIVPAGVSSRFDVEPMIAGWQERLSNPALFIMGVFEENNPMAFINQGPRDDNGPETADAHIVALYVAQSRHRQGIGRKLMALGAKDCMAKGGKTLSLGVLSDNAQGRSFYQALGGRVTKTESFSWHGYDLPVVDFVFEDLPGLAALS